MTQVDLKEGMVVNLIKANETPGITEMSGTDLVPVATPEGALKNITYDNFLAPVSQGFMNVTPSDSPVTGVNIVYPTVAGTYANFGGIVVSSGDMSSGVVTLRKVSGSWTKVITPVALAGYTLKTDFDPVKAMAQNALKASDLTYLNREYGQVVDLNIFDLNKVVPNFILSGTTGLPVAQGGGYAYSGFQLLDKNKRYSVSGISFTGTPQAFAIKYYTVSQAYITGCDQVLTNGLILKIPPEAVYCAFNTAAPAGQLVTSGVQIQELPIGAYTEINIFNRALVVNDQIISGTTNLPVAAGGYKWSGYQPIDPTKVTYINKFSFSSGSASIIIRYYNSSNAYLSSDKQLAAAGVTLSPPTTAAYYAFNILSPTTNPFTVSTSELEVLARTPITANAYSAYGTTRTVMLPAYKEIKQTTDITPNMFTGSDTQRIQQAIDYASGTYNQIRIGVNTNGTSLWRIDSAILLPNNMKVIIDNATIQLSDICRDNMFRSNNVGIGITSPVWNNNISIVGIGEAVLKGADNPRATGDYQRVLSLNPTGSQSYGSDAGVGGQKQTGDWRNNMIEMGYVNGFTLKNVTIQDSHAWAITLERVTNFVVKGIIVHNNEKIKVGGVDKQTWNKDCLDLRQGCKYGIIDDIRGHNGDDLVAITLLDAGYGNGDVNSYQVTKTGSDGAVDNSEHIYISNLQTNYSGVAIRQSHSQSIHHIYIQNVVSQSRPDITPPYGGSPYIVFVYSIDGASAPSGIINNIYASNLRGDGLAFISVQSPVVNCQFTNGIYSGAGGAYVTYGNGVTAGSTTGVTFDGMIKVNQ